MSETAKDRLLAASYVVGGVYLLGLAIGWWPVLPFATACFGLGMISASVRIALGKPL